MPPYELSAQEKAEFRRKYIENVRRANEYLSEGNKIKLDLAAFDKKLNDPKMQRIYKKGLEIRNTTLEKLRISSELSEQFKDLKIQGKKYGLDRLMHSELIPSNDPEARAYNEAKMRDYLLHPEAETERRFHELLNLNLGDVSKIVDSADMKNFFLDFYEKNAAAIDLANETKKALNDLETKTPALAEYGKQVCANFELLANIQDVVNMVKGDEFFTFPDNLTEEQYQELFSDSNYLIDHGELAEAHKNKIVHEKAMEQPEKDFKDFFALCKQNNIDFANGASMCGLYAIDTTTGTKISFSRYSQIQTEKRENPDREENVVRHDPVLGVDLNIDTLQPMILPPETVNEIKQISTVDHTQEEGYLNPQMPVRFRKSIADIARDDVLYNFALDNGKNLGDVASKGLYGLADSFKGNWKERLFGTTSQEYKIFKANLKNYENPNNAAYRQPQSVADSAWAYLTHKGVTTVEEARRLPPPGDSRALLCLSCIKTFDQQYGLVRHPQAPVNQQAPENQNEAQNNNINRQPAIVDPRLLEEDFGDVSVDNGKEVNLSMDYANENEIGND